MYDLISKLCDEQNITITALERTIGIAKGSLCKIDTNSPRLDRLMKIADYFNVSIDYLVNGEEQESFHVSMEEQFIIEAYRKLGESERDMVKRSLGIDDVRESAAREMQKYCTPTANFKAE